MFVDQPNVSMEAFYVNVTVDDYGSGYHSLGISESYTYYLKNHLSENIIQDVFIPVFNDSGNYGDNYVVEEFALYLDGELIDATRNATEMSPWEDLELEMPTDIDYYSNYLHGYSTTIDIPSGRTTEVKMELYGRIIETNNLHYFYSAKTGSYWKGNIGYGYFSFVFLPEHKEMEYEGPSGEVNGNTVVSEMRDWDGDDNYMVSVKIWEINRNVPGDDDLPGFEIVSIISLGVMIIIINLKKRR